MNLGANAKKKQMVRKVPVPRAIVRMAPALSYLLSMKTTSVLGPKMLSQVIE
jgi:hypothetical protein